MIISTDFLTLAHLLSIHYAFVLTFRQTTWSKDQFWIF